MKYIHFELSNLIGLFERTMVQKKIYTYIYHAKSRLNTPVWGSLRSPNHTKYRLNTPCGARFARLINLLTPYCTRKMVPIMGRASSFLEIFFFL